MILVIYVNTTGKNYWAGYFHERDWDNQKYKDEIDKAARKTFSNAKLRRINPITITEVRDVQPGDGQTKQAGKAKGYALQRRRPLAERQKLIRSVAETYQPRDTGIQDKTFGG